ncbi:hypothetical protein FGE12_07940 [Aggregicoccus sp. 17bor-14]|uniref:hypothetical protein n=1 Tax=Myxococcaceae TaxID=31 RepID=UPI00129CC48F|nr:MULTISPECIES: hypothetical protein [Myxococcaceae]MBF5042327.1 hypothetical protein [Simulacricoccus sp. 17bor-14]MRI88100.1 hypothetical protein [Aggregicoccus sp. 17bor-14]
MTSSDEVSAWWAARRRHYNFGLVIAGLAAFVLYVAVVIVKIAPVDPEAEVTLFTTAAQGMGYLLMMGIANLCYGLGPLLERRLAPADVQRFRRRAYALGFGFSVALPFCIPLLLCVLPVVPAEPM